jgi:hypothetical protein
MARSVMIDMRCKFILCSFHHYPFTIIRLYDGSGYLLSFLLEVIELSSEALRRRTMRFIADGGFKLLLLTSISRCSRNQVGSSLGKVTKSKSNSSMNCSLTYLALLPAKDRY